MSTPNIPREDLLILLASFGVSLPLNTKIPTDELHKRLSHTLDAAQQFTAINVPLLPTKYPSWPIDKSLTEASARGNMIEYDKAKTSHKGTTLSTAKEDTFAEVRMNIRNWGKMFAHQQGLFDEVEETLGVDLKMFRWARWVVGDSRYELSVCFDKVPPYTPSW
ncbi:hypothetical protein M413DRAFT_29237 [Hebeloma cylindrosporum]|uniref:Uncharacterized protein n=1 Tax=Hebeloma cylindrosporum TaxID=76867 RepID=A0A0C3C5H0_HEBCY|nr:hypothetical protein M413DRAFT_29237 [Hebeloma cylindrosporum h7]